MSLVSSPISLPGEAILSMDHGIQLPLPLCHLGEKLLSQVPAAGVCWKYHNTTLKQTLSRQAHKHGAKTSCPTRPLLVPELQVPSLRTNSQGTRDTRDLLCCPTLCRKGFAAPEKAPAATHSSCSAVVHHCLRQHDMTLTASSGLTVTGMVLLV